jgi:hypothetical protein
MGSLNAASDDRLAADLLWQMKAIATKEVTSSSMITKKRKTSFSLKLPRIISTSPSISSCESLLEEDSPSPYSYNSPTPTTPTTPTTTAISVGRSRTVSVGSIDMIVPSHKHATKILIKLSPRPTTRTAESHLEHFDWSSNHRAAPGPSLASFPPSPSSLLVGVSSSPLDELPQHQPPTQHPGGKNSKRKREGFVGTAQKPEVAVRGTLRKKFSWKQYPEVRYTQVLSVPCGSMQDSECYYETLKSLTFSFPFLVFLQSSWKSIFSRNKENTLNIPARTTRQSNASTITV